MVNALPSLWEWLEMKDVGFLDSAHCNFESRSYFLDKIRNPYTPLSGKVTYGFFEKDQPIFSKYHGWLMDRQISVPSIQLSIDDLNVIVRNKPNENSCMRHQKVKKIVTNTPNISTFEKMSWKNENLKNLAQIFPNVKELSFCNNHNRLMIF